MGERIDRERSRARIERDIETLAGPDYTLSDSAICRYAYTGVYRNTLAYFTRELEEIGFGVWQDPVGTLIASNVAPDAPAFGVGSHCDSNRNGGKYDGTLGVCTALEVCRLAAEERPELPLRLISFLEEEGSGFGQMLLGSRIMLQRVSEEELRETIRDEHGVSFWDAAEAAGYEPARWRESIRALDNLTGWVEVHIEQGRVLQDTETRLGIVEAIVGYIHGDLHFTRPGRSRRRHADGLPPRRRHSGGRDDRRARTPRRRAGRGRRRDGRRARCGPEPDQRHPRGHAHLTRSALHLDAARPSCATASSRSLGRAAQLAASASSTCSGRSCSCSPWTTAWSPPSPRARRRAARPTGRCLREPHTTRSAWPRGYRARWSSSPASTASRTPRSSSRPGRRRARRGGRLLRHQSSGGVTVRARTGSGPQRAGLTPACGPDPGVTIRLTMRLCGRQSASRWRERSLGIAA